MVVRSLEALEELELGMEMEMRRKGRDGRGGGGQAWVRVEGRTGYRPSVSGRERSGVESSPRSRVVCRRVVVCRVSCVVVEMEVSITRERPEGKWRWAVE